MKFIADLKNFFCLLMYTHCDKQYVGVSITPLNLRVSFTEEENQDMKHLLMNIGMSAKMQQFQFKALKSYQVTVIKHVRVMISTDKITSFCIAYPYGLNERTNFY